MLLDSINPTTHKHARACTRTVASSVDADAFARVDAQSSRVERLGRGARHDRCHDKLPGLIVLVKEEDKGGRGRHGGVERIRGLIIRSLFLLLKTSHVA